MDVVKSFDDIFLDCTSLGVKLKTEEYAVSGQYAIVDQGQHDIAGYTDRTEGVYADVPAIIFGDHTRVIKYIDQPLFLGADGVKLLKAKEESANYKYLYYALRSIRIPNTGYNRHFKWLKESQIEYPDAETQQKVVDTLDKVIGIITIRKQQLSDFDTLIKARFMELFGNPITREKDEELKALGDYCDLKAGKFVKASDIVENNVEGLYPCFGGNGQRLSLIHICGVRRSACSGAAGSGACGKSAGRTGRVGKRRRYDRAWRDAERGDYPAVQRPQGLPGGNTVTRPALCII